MPKEKKRICNVCKAVLSKYNKEDKCFCHSVGDEGIPFYISQRKQIGSPSGIAVVHTQMLERGIRMY